MIGYRTMSLLYKTFMAALFASSSLIQASDIASEGLDDREWVLKKQLLLKQNFKGTHCVTSPHDLTN